MMNGELREFYELGGSRLIIGELLEFGQRGSLFNGELCELTRISVSYFWLITRIFISSELLELVNGEL